MDPLVPRETTAKDGVVCVFHVKPLGRGGFLGDVDCLVVSRETVRALVAIRAVSRGTAITPAG